jgi:hypothetical protein
MNPGRAKRRYLAAAFLPFSAAATAGTDRPAIDFNREIRPILSASCYQCHGPDHKKRKADLRLDTRDGLFRELEGTAVITPGQPQSSELFQRIQSDDDLERMPPPNSAPRLAPAQVALIEKWIRQGAPWKGHWSYLPPSRPTAPVAPSGRTAASPIDDFIDSRLDSLGLEPAPLASRPTLIRRLSFDLIGLPPTPEEVDRFTADEHLMRTNGWSIVCSPRRVMVNEWRSSGSIWSVSPTRPGITAITMSIFRFTATT